jgi:hypothetical protein
MGNRTRPQARLSITQNSPPTKYAYWSILMVLGFFLIISIVMGTAWAFSFLSGDKVIPAVSVALVFCIFSMFGFRLWRNELFG